MSHDENCNDDNCRLFLAGTVALPPSPIIGTLTTDDSGLEGVDKKLLLITQRSPGQQTIVRKVLLKHVCAVELQLAEAPPSKGPKQTPAHEEPKKEWLLGKERIEAHFAGAKGKATEPSKGTVYVPEGVPVWVQADFGVTASDSAEFVPPRGSWPKLGCDCCCP